MALIKAFTTGAGFDAPTAYARLDKVNIDITGKNVQLEVSIYKDKPAAQAADDPFNIMHFRMANQPAVTHMEQDPDEDPGVLMEVVDSPATTYWTDFKNDMATPGADLQTICYLFLKNFRAEFAGATDDV